MSTELAEKLSALVKYQLPDFVRDNYDMFQSFVIAYYEFLEQSTEAQYNIQKAKSFSDIDETIDDFVDYFLKQYAYNIPESVFKNQEFQNISLTNDVLGSKRALAKYLINYHSQKGAEGAAKLLFRMLFDDEITFYYPKEDIFKPSTSEWYVKKTLKVINLSNVTTYNEAINGIIEGVSSGATAVIKDIKRQRGNAYISSSKFVYEVEIENGSLLKEFTPNETVHFHAGNLITGNLDLLYDGKILPVLNSLTIEEKGAGHDLESSIVITDSGIKLFEAKITKLTDIGGIKEVAIIDSGDFEDFESTTYSLEIPVPTLTKAGKYNARQPLISIRLHDNTGNTLLHGIDLEDTVNIQFTTGIIAGNALCDFSNVVANVVTLNSGKIFTIDHPPGFIDAPKGSGNVILNPRMANISINFGTVTSYEGTYLSKESHINDIKKLHDSDYYQEYSYVIRATKSSYLWADILKKALHPVGYRFFPEVYIEVANTVTSVSVVPDTPLYTTILTFLKLLVTDPPVIATSTLSNIVKLQSVGRAARTARYRIGPTYNTLEQFKYDFTNLRIYDIGDLSLEFLSANINEPILIAPPNAIFKGNANIILNSTFDSSSNWSLDSGIAIASGNLNITSATGNASQSFSTPGNVKIMVTFEIKSADAGSVTLFANTNNSSNVISGTSRNSTGNYSEVFYINSPTGNLIINASGFTGNIDNVYVKVLESITY